MCNRTLFTGVFSDGLKCAIIRPLFKKGNKNDISNYRPISVLTYFSKIFEKVMQNRLLKYVTFNNFLSNEQYGFRIKLQTDNATYQLTNEILNALNNKLLIGGILFDLENAFSCVQHKILTSKLEIYGMMVPIINFKNPI